MKARFIASMVIIVWMFAFGAQSATATPIFVNGDFEAGAGGAFPNPMTAANTPGWTFGSSSDFPMLAANIACGGTYGAGNSGCNYAVLGGGETGGAGFIQQTLSGFVAGDEYTLSWLQSSEAGPRDRVNAVIEGVSTLSMDFSSDPYPGGAAFWGGWQTETWSFIADSSTLTFRFHALGSTYANCASGRDSCDPGVDNFQISSVPEPASLILLGTGLAAARMKRRRKTA